jgi:hypothetical protein
VSFDGIVVEEEETCASNRRRRGAWRRAHLHRWIPELCRDRHIWSELREGRENERQMSHPGIF